MIRPWSLPLLLLSVGLLTIPGRADETGRTGERWWEKRRQQPALFYPHNKHLAIMAEEGDPCMRCHPFNPAAGKNSDLHRRLAPIANEPMMAICHDCHVTRRRASWSCDLCHPDPETIRPKDHGFDYANHHAEAVRRDADSCETCHLDQAFCTDCHFQRLGGPDHEHPPGYADSHGLDARLDALTCSGCHQSFFCRDCHRRRP